MIKNPETFIHPETRPEINKTIQRMKGTHQMQKRMDQKTFGIKPEEFSNIDVTYSYTAAKISDALDEDDHDEMERANETKKSIQNENDFSKYIILSENSYFCMGWNVIDLICSIISSYVYGWMAVFGTIEANGDPNYAVIYLDYTFFIIFSITILITFVTDYTPQGENTPVKNLE